MEPVSMDETLFITEEGATNSSLCPPSLNQYDVPMFVEACHCGIYEKLMKDDLLIKEATTGYLDPETGLESGNFVTYVIEFGVINSR